MTALQRWASSGTRILCDWGRTALLLASERGHTETVRVLVELGASLEAVDKVNAT